MSIDTTKESVCVNQLIGQKSENRTIEGDMIVPDIKPDILDTIMTSGNVCIYKKEVLDGKVKIDGTVQVYIIYLADDETGSTRALNTSLDFTEVIPIQNCTPGMSLVTKAKVCSVDARVLNGRKINIKANVNFSLKLYSNENVDIISQINGIDDIQKLNHEIEVNSLIGEGWTKALARETIAIDPIDNLAEILSAEIRITNKDTKVSYNKVLVKADAIIRILYLTEDNRINSVQSTIPVMGFIDMQNVSEDHVCDTNYELKNLLIKPNGEEDHSIYVEAELEICCFAFEKRNITITEDLYSPSQNLSFTQKTIHLIAGKNSNRDICSIKEKISVPELMGNRICNVVVNPVISSQNVINNRASYDGQVQINILFWNESENRLGAKELSLPFEFSMEVQGDNNENDIDTEMEIERQDFVILPDGDLDARVDIAFFANASNFRDASVIDEIMVDDTSGREDCSMVIYFAKPGDTLWKIAKKFGSTVDEIARINGIENPDILQVGRQLFIPRYCARQTA